jgi:hypothetical protein
MPLIFPRIGPQEVAGREYGDLGSAKPYAAVSGSNGAIRMFVRDVVASLARRWYLSFAGLLVTAGLAFVALQLVPPAWESKASVVLLPPKSTVEPGGNPYLELGGLSPTLDLLVVTLDDQQMVQLIKSVSPTAEYTVEADTTSSGPVMVVTVQDRTPVDAVAARDELVRQAPVRLAELQDNLAIPSRSHITSMVLTQDREPEIVGKNQLRALVVAVGTGVVGTALLVALIDGYLTRRRLAAVEVVSGGEEASFDAAAGSDFQQRPDRAASLAAVEVGSGGEEASFDAAADWEPPWWHSAAQPVQSTNGQHRPLRDSDSPTSYGEARDEPLAPQAARANASAGARRL